MKPIWRGVRLATLILGFGLSGISCGGDDSNPMNPGPTADVTIDIVADAGTSSYGASPVTVNLNQKVAWRNTRAMTHTATSTGGPAGGQWNTGNIGAGSTSAAITMTTAGTYPYHCAVAGHNMTGSLVVNP